MPTKHPSTPDIEELVKKLSPEERQIYDTILEEAKNERKVQMAGYAASAIVLFLGLLFAYFWHGKNIQQNNLWIFCVPFLAAGFILVVFAKLSKKSST